MSIVEVGKGSDRIEMLGYDVLSIISDGKTESVDVVIKHLEDADLVHYLVDKYKESFNLVYEGCPYDLDEWEKVFAPYSYLTFGHDVSRKMGLCNQEKDGLLVIMNIILQEISERKYK